MPTIEELQDSSRYETALQLRHQDLATQIRPYLKLSSWVMISYWCLNVVCLTVIVAVIARSQGDIALAFSSACLGMVLGYMALLPVHESAHAFAYRMLGYSQVSVRYSFRNLTAMCLADRQILQGREFVIVCLTPFVIINPLLIVAATAAPGIVQIVLLGALFLHIGACSGDLALVNFVWHNRRTDLFTYDDVEEGMSYFLRPKSIH